jgi:hypothetical protein
MGCLCNKKLTEPSVDTFPESTVTVSPPNTEDKIIVYYLFIIGI